MIKNALVADVSRCETVKRDIFAENGRIVRALSVPPDEIIDAEDLIAAPGLVDMHVHFRDPGFTYKEDILSGAEAAAAGGVTTAACMPNTNPCIDTPETVRYVLDRAKDAKIRVLPIAAVTIGQRGETLTDFRALKDAGAVALSDDGNPVMNAAVMRDALLLAKECGLLIISHCEDAFLARNYAVNDGEIAKKLGITGRPAVAEELMIARDILLAKETGARVHIAHVSARGSVELVRRAKNDGVNVTCETCPQYFSLTEDEILRQSALARVNPPLRTQDDVYAILDGLRDGTIDVIATDHAPHADHEKSLPLTEAPSGMIGLETLLSVTLTALVHENVLTIADALGRMSVISARLLGLDAGTLDIGAPADIVLLDPDEKWTVAAEDFKSKARNSAFIGKTMRGRVKRVFAGGTPVF